MLFLTLCISISPEEPLLSLDVDEELLPDPLHAAVHSGGVNLVEEEVHEPGAQECHPPHCHHHSHLGYILIEVTFMSLFDLELCEVVDVPVGVHHLDAVHGHHGDLRGDCQPVYCTSQSQSK